MTVDEARESLGHQVAAAIHSMLAHRAMRTNELIAALDRNRPSAHGVNEALLRGLLSATPVTSDVNIDFISDVALILGCAIHVSLSERAPDVPDVPLDPTEAPSP